MPLKSWILTQRTADGATHIESLSLGPKDCDAPASAKFRIHKQTLRGGLADGVEVIAVDNGCVRFTVIPTRGMGIGHLALADGRQIGWRSPVLGPVHPKFVNLADPTGLGWLDGFDEFLCRCGLESNGAPEFDEHHAVRYPLHGRIANLPAHRVEVAYDSDAGEIVVSGETDETRFLVRALRLKTVIRTKPGEAGFRVRDEVVNLSGKPADAQLLYHINFGGNLLDAGSRVVAPVKTLVPRNAHAASAIDQWDHYAAPQRGFTEQVYFAQLHADGAGRTRTVLRNAHGTLAASVAFDVRNLPFFALWKNTGAVEDGYVTGLEPSTNFPNPRSFEKEHGRVVTLAPGESRSFEVGVEVADGAAAVAAAEKAVATLQAAGKPTVHREPLGDWCAS